MQGLVIGDTFMIVVDFHGFWTVEPPNHRHFGVDRLRLVE
jgi:hypothetical protein